MFLLYLKILPLSRSRLGFRSFFPGGRCFLKNEITHKLRRHADTDSWERNVFSVVLLFFSFFPQNQGRRASTEREKIENPDIKSCENKKVRKRKKSIVWCSKSYCLPFPRLNRLPLERRRVESAASVKAEIERVI